MIFEIPKYKDWYVRVSCNFSTSWLTPARGICNHRCWRGRPRYCGRDIDCCGCSAFFLLLSLALLELCRNRLGAKHTGMECKLTIALALAAFAALSSSLMEDHSL